MNLTTSLVKNIHHARARLGECPVWDDRNKCLYWVDIYNHRLHQLEPSTDNNRCFDVGDMVSAIAIIDEKQLLLGLRDRLAILNIQTGAIATKCQIQFDHVSTRLNDGKCDLQGRFWIGSVSEEPAAASLYRYDPDGSLQVMETGLTISNGLGWSPDGKVFYLTDSAEKQIYAYDFDGETGKISHRRVLIDLADEPVEPDGLAIDQQGNLWSALWDGWAIACFDPTGTEIQRLQLPVQRPTCPCFGGANLTDLYITSASVGLSQTEIQRGFYAGDVFHVSTTIPGMMISAFLIRNSL